MKGFVTGKELWISVRPRVSVMPLFSGRVTSAAAKEAAIKEKRGQLFSHMRFRIRVAV